MIKRWCLLVGLGLVWVAASAQGADVTWNTDSGGAYTNTSNWTDLSNASHHVPTSTDRAIFNRNLNIAYGITFPGRPIFSPLTREVRQLSVGTNAVTFSDDVDFNELPANFAVDFGNAAGTSAMIVGDTAGHVGTLTTTLASFSAGSATVGNAAGSTGTINVAGGAFSITGSSPIYIEFMIGNAGNGTLNVSNGAHVGGGRLMIVAVNSGSTGAATVTGAGSTLTALDLTIGRAGNASLTVSSGGAATANGTLSVGNANSSATVTGSGSTITAHGLDVHSGTLTIQNNGHVSSTDGFISGPASTPGTVDVGAGASWSNSQFLHVGYGSAGILNIHGGGQVTSSALFVGVFVPPMNPGQGSVTIDGAGSSLTVSNAVSIGTTGAATVSVVNGGLLSVTNQLTVGQMGTLLGNSTVAANIVNEGTVAPGTSPAALHVTGNYSQQAAGNLKIELGGTNPGVTYDQLLVTGTMAAGGVLDVTRVDLGSGLFSPQSGDSFNILDFSSLSGTFTTVNLPPLDSNLAWSTSQLYSDGIIRVVPLGVSGDYNNNGGVDAADYVAWRKNNNTAVTLPNDATPGTSAADYSVWRAHFGQTAGSGSSVVGVMSGAIPEPTSVVLVLIAGAACVARGRRPVRLR